MRFLWKKRENIRKREYVGLICDPDKFERAVAKATYKHTLLQALDDHQRRPSRISARKSR